MKRSAFTLIELLVSVALAIIILTLFATIYSWSIDTYTTQKGIRRNDQRSRMLVTVIKGDLDNRTFRNVVPFWPGQITTGFTGLPGRRGYFCISENDPNNHSDDVLFLTVEIPTDATQRAYNGRAKVLFNPLAIDPRTGATYTDDATGWARYLIDHPNQPEHDDGKVAVVGTPVGVLNSAGQSRAAEIAYFLRNGNLYRRSMLIRDVYDAGSSTTGDQPEQLSGLYGPALARTTDPSVPVGVFWRDFSYSAYYKGGASPGPKFHGRNSSLANENPSSNVDPDFLFPRSLGIPPLRFGYSLSSGVSQFTPREFVPQTLDGMGNAVPQNTFIGRFLDQEAGDPDFVYPGSISTNGNPHTRTPLTLNPSSGLVQEYSTTNFHRGADILMTNVHEFDIKVFDDQLLRFVDLGHSEPTGYYRRSVNNRGLSDEWNRFDTWHPYSSLLSPPDTVPYAPPYKAKSTGQATGSMDPPLGSADERALLAIQITIRFFDVSTKQLRQVTIQHSLRR